MARRLCLKGIEHFNCLEDGKHAWRGLLRLRKWLLGRELQALSCHSSAPGVWSCEGRQFTDLGGSGLGFPGGVCDGDLSAKFCPLTGCHCGSHQAQVSRAGSPVSGVHPEGEATSDSHSHQSQFSHENIYMEVWSGGSTLLSKYSKAEAGGLL